MSIKEITKSVYLKKEKKKEDEAIESMIYNRIE